MTVSLCKGKTWTQRQMPAEGGGCEDTERTPTTSRGMPGDPGHQEEACDNFSLAAQKEPALPAAWSLTCSFQNFYYTSPPSLWFFVMAAPENEYWHVWHFTVKKKKKKNGSPEASRFPQLMVNVI